MYILGRDCAVCNSGQQYPIDGPQDSIRTPLGGSFQLQDTAVKIETA